VLHSLRHTVKQMLPAAGPPHSHVAYLLGHPPPAHPTPTSAPPATVERMAEWIERLPLQSILGRNDSSIG
jgi:hypothetical protein